MIELAIIGGGPSAACVVQAVTQRLAPLAPVSITVFEPGPNLWRGRVFQPNGDEVLANVSMKDMSARAWDADHGVRWLGDHNLAHLATDMAFSGRSLVGRYIEDSVDQAVATLHSLGSRLRVEKQAVHELIMDKGRLRVHGDGWHAGPFNHAVLCVGAPASYDHYQLAGADGFVGDPYPLRQSQAEIPANARVGIVGSGLTAVDVVMGLRARGHQGPITMFSRKGMLPAVRRQPVKRELRHLTVSGVEHLAAQNEGLSVDDVTGLVLAELADAGANVAAIKDDLACGAPAVQSLRDDLTRAQEDPDVGWSVLRDGMVVCGQDAWFLLREEEKARMRASRQTLMRHCCPMPPGNAERLLGLFDTGQLDIIPGVHSIRPRPNGGFHIGAERDLTVDVVVAASTLAHHQPSPAARPLLTSLSAQGLVVEHRYGGIRVERTSSRLVTWRGVADPRLHALGDITHGAYLFTFEMPVLAMRADRIAEDIALTIEKGIRRDHLSVRDGQGAANAQAAGLPGPRRRAAAREAPVDSSGEAVRALRI